MKILFFDPLSGGHRKKYCEDFLNELAIQTRSNMEIGLAVSEDFDTTGLDKSIRIYKLKNKVRPGNLLLFYIKYLKSLIEVNNIFCRDKYEVLHHLYLDSFIIPTSLFYLLFNRDYSLIGVLHWAEMDSGRYDILYRLFKRAERFLWFQLIKKSKFIIIHGEAIKIKILSGLPSELKDKFYFLPYPIGIKGTEFIAKEKAREYLCLSQEKIMLLAFGGTRYEKGSDILLSAISKLPESINIIVVFAGEEKHFTREYFDTKIKEYKLINKVILRLGFIKDDDMQYYYSACDGVILPYRKNFLGQSGPLTFAAKYCKPVIASDVLELKHIVIKYHTGICFIAEDEDSLAEKIIEFHDNLKKYQNNKFKNNIRKYLSISSLQNSIKTYIRIIGMNNSL